jgi:hypothetical protein
VPFGRRGLHHLGAASPSPLLDGVRVEAEHAQLGAQPATFTAGERAVPGMLVVGVVGVQHHLDAADVEGGEVGIRIVDRRGQDPREKLHGLRHAVNEKVDRERRQLAPVAVPRFPGIARALLHRDGPPGRANIDRAAAC